MRAVKDGASADFAAKVSGRIVTPKGREGVAVRSLLTIEPSDAMDRAAEAECGVMMSADAVLHADEIATLFSEEPLTVPIYAGDGAPVTRATITRKSASRAAVFGDDKQFTVGGKHLELLSTAGEWLAKHPGASKLLVVTWLRLATLLRYTLATERGDAAAQKEQGRTWIKLGLYPSDLPALTAEVAAVLKTFPKLAAFEVLHYNATRGIDAFKGFDALITIGDPIPFMPAVRAEGEHMGLDEDEIEKLPNLRAAAELGQAHGRLRAPRRTAAAVALHIGRGSVVPAGWEILCAGNIADGDSLIGQVEAGALGGASGVLGAVHGIKGTRPMNDNDTAFCEKVARLRTAHTDKELADVFGVSPRTISRWAKGGMRIEPDKQAILDRCA